MSEWGYSLDTQRQCVKEFGNWHTAQFWKHNDDLRRYEDIIKVTRPDVIIETGTNTGASACWLSSPRYAYSTHEIHPVVITIDVDKTRWNRASQPYNVYRLFGSSIDPKIVQAVREHISPKSRVMVSLDSDHSSHHVQQEIELYAPLVTSGCHLVVEDGILAWITEEQRDAHACHYEGNPLDAIDAVRYNSSALDDFERDELIEGAYPVTMHPAGWWRRK
jgi:cephalosporin hydroxylase